MGDSAMIAITPSAPGTVPRSNDLGGPDDLSGTVVRRSLVRGWRRSADAYRSDLEEHLRPLSLGALGLASGAVVVIRRLGGTLGISSLEEARMLVEGAHRPALGGRRVDVDCAVFDSSEDLLVGYLVARVAPDPGAWWWQTMGPMWNPTAPADRVAAVLGQFITVLPSVVDRTGPTIMRALLADLGDEWCGVLADALVASGIPDVASVAAISATQKSQQTHGVMTVVGDADLGVDRLGTLLGLDAGNSPGFQTRGAEPEGPEAELVGSRCERRLDTDGAPEVGSYGAPRAARAGRANAYGPNRDAAAGSGLAGRLLGARGPSSDPTALPGSTGKRWVDGGSPPNVAGASVAALGGSGVERVATGLGGLWYLLAPYDAVLQELDLRPAPAGVWAGFSSVGREVLSLLGSGVPRDPVWALLDRLADSARSEAAWDDTSQLASGALGQMAIAERVLDGFAAGSHFLSGGLRLAAVVLVSDTANESMVDRVSHTVVEVRVDPRLADAEVRRLGYDWDLSLSGVFGVNLRFRFE